MLGDTDTLVTCLPCCLGTDNMSIRDRDTALPGDRCRDPGVAAPLSVLDITMVGTRSVLLLWAVRTPGDRAPSSPSDVRTVTVCYGLTGNMQHNCGNIEWLHHHGGKEGRKKKRENKRRTQWWPHSELIMLLHYNINSHYTDKIIRRF